MPISAVEQGAAQSRVAQVHEKLANALREAKLGRNPGIEVESVSGIAAGDAMVMSRDVLRADSAEIPVRAGAPSAP